MSFWTYYSPLGLGLLLTLLLHEVVWAHAPLALPVWTYWPFVVAVGVGVGLLCQLLLIGVQGAFAQVLPVPIGRSVRGRGAAAAGSLIIACVVLAVIASLLRSEGLGRAGLVVGLLGVGAGAAAAIIYVWCWPVAVRDFDKRG